MSINEENCSFFSFFSGGTFSAPLHLISSAGLQFPSQVLATDLHPDQVLAPDLHPDLQVDHMDLHEGSGDLQVTDGQLGDLPHTLQLTPGRAM